MPKVKLRFVQLINFTRQSDREKAEKIRHLIEETINDSEFQQKILNADFKDRRFTDEKNNTSEIEENEIILNKILSGKEQYSNDVADNEWDLKISLYRSLTTELGHRNRDTILTKKRKFRVLSERMIAAHWIHEYVHVIGFTHDYKRTKVRPYSVPYLVGSIANELLESKEFDFLT